MNLAITERMNKLIEPLSKAEKYWLLMMLMDNTSTQDLMDTYEGKLYWRVNANGFDKNLCMYRDAIKTARLIYEESKEVR